MTVDGRIGQVLRTFAAMPDVNLVTVAAGEGTEVTLGRSGAGFAALVRRPGEPAARLAFASEEELVSWWQALGAGPALGRAA